MRSILYWHPYIYKFLMKLRFKKYFNERYEAINELIPAGSSVVDVCCGDSFLYSFLKNKKIEYLGLDFNPSFIKNSIKQGINVKLFNIYEDPIPPADFVVIQASLYQFIPNHQKLLHKLYNSANKYLIITETIDSYGSSNNKFISFVGKILNNPGDGIKKERFTYLTFKKAIEPFKNKIENEISICGDLDILVSIKK